MCLWYSVTSFYSEISCVLEHASPPGGLFSDCCRYWYSCLLLHTAPGIERQGGVVLVGWALGPDHLLRHLRTVHQNSIYHCPTAAQEAVAHGFQIELQRFGQQDSYFVQLPQELQRKRDRLFHSLVAAGMQPIMPEGSYFMLVDISDFRAEVPAPEDTDQPYDYFFVKWMMKNKHLAAIPGSAFYGAEHKKRFDNFIRFCFVKEDATLDAAEDILQQWRGTRKAS